MNDAVTLSHFSCDWNTSSAQFYVSRKKCIGTPKKFAKKAAKREGKNYIGVSKLKFTSYLQATISKVAILPHAFASISL